MTKNQMITELTNGMYDEASLKEFLTEVRDIMVRHFLNAETNEVDKFECNIYYVDINRLIKLL